MGHNMRRGAIIFSVILCVLLGTTSSAEGALTSIEFWKEVDPLFDDEKYDEVITYCDKALENNPDYSTAYYYRSRAYHLSGEYSKAVSDISKAMELEPDHMGYYFIRGSSYRELEDYPNAISDYSKYIEEKNPDNPSVYTARAEFYFKLEDYTNSISDYSKAIELSPKSANSYYKRALSYEKLNEPEKAQSDYVKAASLDSKYEKYVTKTTPTTTTQEHTTTVSSGEGEEISDDDKFEECMRPYNQMFRECSDISVRCVDECERDFGPNTNGAVVCMETTCWPDYNKCYAFDALRNHDMHLPMCKEQAYGGKYTTEDAETTKKINNCVNQRCLTNLEDIDVESLNKCVSACENEFFTVGGVLIKETPPPTTSPPKTITTQTKDISGSSGFSLNPFKLIKSFFGKIFPSIFGTPTEFDFDVGVSTHSVTVEQKGTAEVGVSVDLVKGEKKPVALTITSWGTADISAWFVPSTVSPSGGARLYIKTTCNTPTGDYLHTVQGASGTRSSVDAVTLWVTANPKCP